MKTLKELRTDFEYQVKNVKLIGMKEFSTGKHSIFRDASYTNMEALHKIHNPPPGSFGARHPASIIITTKQKGGKKKDGGAKE